MVARLDLIRMGCPAPPVRVRRGCHMRTKVARSVPTPEQQQTVLVKTPDAASRSQDYIAGPYGSGRLSRDDAGEKPYLFRPG